MARPKSEDPTVPIQFRMKRSAWEAWQAKARRVGAEKPQAFLREVAEGLAIGFASEAEFGRVMKMTNQTSAGGKAAAAKLKKLAEQAEPCKHPVNLRIGTGCAACGKEKL